MKKITLSFSVLAITALAVISCKKPVDPVAPVADTEFQSSVDATYGLFSFTDAEMIGSFISDNSLEPKFYMPAAGSAGTVEPVQDTTADVISFGFNVTTCLDGRFRDGTVVLNREIDLSRKYNPYANPNSRYYRTVGYAERMTLSNYRVDGWRMVTVDANNVNEGQEVEVVNLLTTDNWNPLVTNLSWSIKGNFKMTKDDQVLFFRMDLLKTLENTSDPKVFAATKKASITWSLATVSYSGKLSGTINGKAFSMEITPENRIMRNFTCTPDVVTSVATTNTVGTVAQKTSEYHPFINGIASFSITNAAGADLYPRQIYYGGSETDGAGQCDNSGSVLIKGISYPIDFRRQ